MKKIIGLDIYISNVHTCIIGAGPAGISALENIQKLDKDTSITIIAKEQKPYSLSALPYYFYENFNIYLPLDCLKKSNVIPMLGCKVVSIDPDNYTIYFDNGKNREMRYDNLLIATGSVPVVPKISGIEKDNVYYLNSIDDAIKIRDWVHKHKCECKNVVIIGAGFTGLECCVAFRNLGLNVTVVEMENRVLPRMVDKDISAVVENILLKNGVKIFLNDRVVEIVGDNKVNGVKLAHHKDIIKADMVLVSVGVKPNIELVKNTKIKINRGIIVDDRMRTSAECVYAAGDVAEYVESGMSLITQVWLNAVYQGKVAGSNIVGVERRFVQMPIVNIITIFGVPVLGIGMPSENKSKIDVLKFNNLKILSKNGCVVGIQAVGNVCGGLTNLISQPIDEIEKSILKRKFFHPAIKSKIKSKW